jgi:hypothetical protein
LETEINSSATEISLLPEYGKLLRTEWHDLLLDKNNPAIMKHWPSPLFRACNVLLAAASVDLNRLPVEPNLIHSFRFILGMNWHDGAKTQHLPSTEVAYEAVP